MSLGAVADWWRGDTLVFVHGTGVRQPAHSLVSTDSQGRGDQRPAVASGSRALPSGSAMELRTPSASDVTIPELPRYAVPPSEQSLAAVRRLPASGNAPIAVRADAAGHGAPWSAARPLDSPGRLRQGYAQAQYHHTGGAAIEGDSPRRRHQPHPGTTKLDRESSAEADREAPTSILSNLAHASANVRLYLGGDGWPASGMLSALPCRFA